MYYKSNSAKPKKTVLLWEQNGTATLRCHTAGCYRQ